MGPLHHVGTVSEALPEKKWDAGGKPTRGVASRLGLGYSALDSRGRGSPWTEEDAFETNRNGAQAMKRTAAEVEAEYERLQAELPGQAQEMLTFSERPHTVVVIPSLSLDAEQLSKVKGISFYEERMLYLLLLLRQPHAKMILVTSQLVDPRSIDYVLSLLPTETLRTAKQRLITYNTNDWSPKPLAQKVLERPWLLKRIQEHIDDPAHCHMVTFNMTRSELELSVALGVPIVGMDPRKEYWGTKSGNRRIFEEAGVRAAAGISDLTRAAEVAPALCKLWEENPASLRILVKLNEGFSGEGNAILDLRKLPHLAPGKVGSEERIRGLESSLDQLVFQSSDETWEKFSRQFDEKGGIVEVFLEGEEKVSPSVQLRVDILDDLYEISTHDQVLGGAENQVFLGCRFPADEAYRATIQEQARRVTKVLREKGIQSRVGVDFMLIRQPDGSWESYAIEINIRRGGTTHPFASMHFLIQGEYDSETGRYFTPEGEERVYLASDNVEREEWGGLLPEDLVQMIEDLGIGFDHESQTGNVFHMLGAASQFQKIGYTSIAPTHEEARELFQRTQDVLAQKVRSLEPFLTVPEDAK